MRANLLTILCAFLAFFIWGCDKDSPDPNTPAKVEATAKVKATGKVGDPPPQPTQSAKAKAPPAATAKPKATAKAKTGAMLQLRVWDRGLVLLNKGATLSVPKNGTLILMPYPSPKKEGDLIVQGPFEKEVRGHVLALVFKGDRASLGKQDVVITAYGDTFPLQLVVTK